MRRRRNRFTVGSSTSVTFVLPAHHGTCVAFQTKRMETDRLRAVMTKLKHAQADDVAIPQKMLFVFFRRHKIYALQDIHLGHTRITCSCPFCGKCGTVRYHHHPLLNL